MKGSIAVIVTCLIGIAIIAGLTKYSVDLVRDQHGSPIITNQFIFTNQVYGESFITNMVISNIVPATVISNSIN